ncbi:MAG: TMEM165/GDT1 family protein [Acidimicrobiales bacterium]
MNLALAATVFGVVFVGELPDKSLIASLVLSTRHRPFPVWLGAAGAFVVEVAVAVVAGGLFALLPHRLVEAVVAVLFAAGGVFVLLTARRGPPAEGPALAEAAPPRRSGRRPAPLGRVVATSFGVVFLAEWGDITQVATANFAAQYADPLSVAVGALAALWAVSGLALSVGAKVLERVPIYRAQQCMALILLGFAAYSAVRAATG